MTSLATMTKREVAKQVIDNMKVGVWYELGELAVQARYNRGFCLSRFEMGQYLREQKTLGFLDHKTACRRIGLRQQYRSFWRRKDGDMTK